LKEIKKARGGGDDFQEPEGFLKELIADKSFIAGCLIFYFTSSKVFSYKSLIEL
jgi:hypothetical protein